MSTPQYFLGETKYSADADRKLLNGMIDTFDKSSLSLPEWFVQAADQLRIIIFYLKIEPGEILTILNKIESKLREAESINEIIDLLSENATPSIYNLIAIEENKHQIKHGDLLIRLLDIFKKNLMSIEKYGKPINASNNFNSTAKTYTTVEATEEKTEERRGPGM